MKFSTFFVVIFLFCYCQNVWAWPLVYPTGLTVYNEEKAYEGYTLVRSEEAQKIFLIDMEGLIAHSWDLSGLDTNNHAGQVELLENGNILVGRSPLVEMDWDAKIVWQYDAPLIHHDFFRMENGNTLVVAQENTTDSNVSPIPIADDVIYEVTPEKEIVWTWKTRDHIDELGLSPTARSLISDVGGDWAHMNSMEPLGQNFRQNLDDRFAPDNIIVSYRNINTIAIIDKDTGDICWKMGEEETADMGVIIGQHDAQMISYELPGAGNIIVFDNGGTSGYPEMNRHFSRVVEINPDTKSLVWQYPQDVEDNLQFFSFNISSAQRLPNGNTLIAEGMNGRFFEVTMNCEIVWEFVNPFGKEPLAQGLGAKTFRVRRYANDYAPMDLKITEADEQTNVELANIQEHLQQITESMDKVNCLQVEGDCTETPEETVEYSLLSAVPVAKEKKQAYELAGVSCFVNTAGQ